MAQESDDDIVARTYRRFRSDLLMANRLGVPLDRWQEFVRAQLSPQAHYILLKLANDKDIARELLRAFI